MELADVGVSLYAAPLPNDFGGILNSGTRVGMSVQDTIRKYWIARYGFTPLRWLQRGGATMNIDGHPLTFHVEQSKRTVFTVLTGKRTSPCSVLGLNFATHVATLDVVSHRDTCFTNGYTNMRSVVRGAYEFAKRKGMQRLILTDKSEIMCPPTQSVGSEPPSGAGWASAVPLADLSFLTTGRTWYESIIPGLMCVSPNYNIEELRARARAATWVSVGADLLPSLAVADPDEPGSAMRVLAMLKQAKTYCDFFSRNMTLLVARSYGRSLMSSQWEASIPQSAPVRRHTHRRRNISFRFSRSAKTNRVYTAPILNSAPE